MGDTMRVALVIDRFDSRRGGAQQWTRRFAIWLQESGCDVHVIARQFGQVERELDITRHTIQLGKSPIRFASAVKRQLDRLRVDVSHDMGSSWCCDIFQPHHGSQYATFERKIAAQRIWQQPIRRQLVRMLPRYRQFEQCVQRQYDSRQRLYIALSEMVARDLQNYHGAPADRIRTVYNGVDVSRFHPRRRQEHRQRIRSQLGIREDEVLVLIVAHNFRLKGIPNLVRAIATLRSQNFPARLVVCGGQNRPHFWPRKVGADESVWMMGPVDDPVPYYAAADVYAQPTFYDACSLVVLEAAASGLPIVTTQFNGASELLTEGNEGFIMQDPGNLDQLVDYLRTLMNPEQRLQMGRAARCLAEKHTSDANFSQIMNLYEEFCCSIQRSAA